MKMSRSFVVGLLFISLITSGCSLFGQDTAVPQAGEEEKVLDKRTGIIEVQLDAATHQVKHVLKTENGETITLVSLNINLDTSVGHKVEVEGIYEPRLQQLDVELITTISDELQNKKDYMNGALGVQFSFPQNWTLDESQVATTKKLLIYPFVPTQDAKTAQIDGISISRLDNSDKKSPREWLNLDEFFRPVGATDQLSGLPAKTYQESVIGKQQYAAVKETDITNGQRISFYVQRDVHMYQISFVDSTPDTSTTANENAFFEMISSFDFIPFTSATVGVVTPSVPSPTGTTPPQQGIAVGEPNPSAPGGFVPPVVTPPVTSTAQVDFAPYQTALSKKIAQLAPEASKNGGTWTITRYEFTMNSTTQTLVGAYITYSDGTDVRRIYGTFSDPKNPDSFTRTTYFKPGAVASWDIAEGTDSGKSYDKTTITAGGATQTTIMAGMQLIEARTWKANFQVPAKWYWSITSNGYVFDTKPIGSQDAPVRLSNKQETASGDFKSSCVTKKATYCITYKADFFGSAASDTTIVDKILASIQEN